MLSKMTWRERRKLSYLINQFDDRNLSYSIDSNNIPQQVISFFNTQSELVYPAKSYFVAIIYAKCLNHYFHIPFYEALSQDDLLIDDIGFKSYMQDPNTYDTILNSIDDPLSYKSAEKTINYFKQEFLICN